MISKMEILRVENLSKHYGNGETMVKALNNISFSVNKGEFVSIIGASGSRQIYSFTYIRWSR